MATMVLDPERVEAIFKDCLFKEGEPTEPRVEVEGIVNRFGFHPERVEQHSEEIGALLAELPDEFKQSSGGGWTFLNACNDRHGNQWTGLHQRMEQLFALGMATDRVACQLPREMWAVLPGGVPYYIVKDQPENPRVGGDRL
jgi:hypothetical protein